MLTSSRVTGKAQSRAQHVLRTGQDGITVAAAAPNRTRHAWRWVQSEYINWGGVCLGVTHEIKGHCGAHHRIVKAMKGYECRTQRAIRGCTRSRRRSYIQVRAPLSRRKVSEHKNHVDCLVAKGAHDERAMLKSRRISCE
jgi:hypothetical protein